MKLENAFEVPVPPAEAWRILTDVERIVPCVPGAALTEVVDDRTYKGAIKVKLGPVALSFAGDIRFEEMDEAARRARVKAAGRESRGRGAANADVLFALQPDGDGTRVAITTDLQLSGMVAQYGRSAGIVAAVSEEMTRDFAACLRARIVDAPTGDGGGPAAADPPPAEAISAVALAWRLVKRFFRGLFGRSRQ